MWGGATGLPVRGKQKQAVSEFQASLGYTVRLCLKKQEEPRGGNATPLIPALRGKGRWISESEATLVYSVSSRTARATKRKQSHQKRKEKKRKKKKQNKSKQTKIFH